MDLAVGVIIGAAFGKITTSLVEDVIMPIIAFIMGGEFDFKNMFILLGDASAGVPMTYEVLKEAGAPMLAYGSFITVVINFIILAFIIFMMVKAMNKLRRKAEEPTAPEEPAQQRRFCCCVRSVQNLAKKDKLFAIINAAKLSGIYF